MESNSIINKALFYSTNKINCHVKLLPDRYERFKNGMITSELIEGKYFWFIDLRKPELTVRLFLYDIVDIEDYIEEVKE